MHGQAADTGTGQRRQGRPAWSLHHPVASPGSRQVELCPAEARAEALSVHDSCTSLASRPAQGTGSWGFGSPPR